ncbi:MAG: hypothetical protein KIT14_00355 [bacterium]|nr:hypothetical protein [bacterium]
MDAIGDPSDADAIRVGARVITLQRPGIFTVVARAGRICEIAGADGTRLRLLDVALRTVVDPDTDPPA